MKKFAQILEKAQGFFGVILFVALVLVVFFQVITRYILHTPLLWSEEVARFLLFWVALMGASMSVKNKKHFVIDLIRIEKIKGRFWRKFLSMIPDLLILFFGVFMTIVGYSYCIMGSLRVATNSQITMCYVFAAIPITGITVALYSLFHILVALKNLDKSS